MGSRAGVVKILVTGHRGFIGAHLVRELKNNGHTIHGADILEHGYDLREPGRLAGWLDRITEPDALVHLAAQVGRVFGERDLRHTISSNAELTAVVAQECGQRGVPVLYASSSEVYGDHRDSVCHETSSCVLPHNLYGLTKRWGEEALQLYAPDGLKIVRLSMPYGPGAPPGVGRRALDNILWQAHHGKPIPIHDGAERSWCWIEDTVRGIRLVLEKGAGYDARVPGTGIYNIGRDDRPLSMLSLAERCCQLAGASTELIDLIPAPAAQTVVKRLSTEKLRRLGWRPTVELSEGLPQVLEWVTRFDANGDWTESEEPSHATHSSIRKGHR
jgi:nucleoside-diphosphate-sugar epimerase